MYNHLNGELIERQSIDGTRYHHGCGLVTKEDGTQEVVIAGGYQSNKIVDSVQIYDLAADTWR